MVRHLPILCVLVTGLLLRMGGLWYGLPSKNLALTTYHPDEPKSFYSLERMAAAHTLNPGDGFFWGSLHLYTLGFSLQIAKNLKWIRVPSRQYLTENFWMADRLYIVGRLLSIFFGVATIFLIYLIGKECVNNLCGVLSALLLALSPAHIFNSFVVRPDVMMIFLAMLVLYFSFKLLESDRLLYPLLAGLFSGLAAATKYNGGIFIFCPLLAHCLKRKEPLKFLWIIFFSLIGFVIGCPYALLDFQTFLKYLEMNASLSKDGISPILYGPGWKSYLTVYLPYGIGGATTLLGLAGFSTLGFVMFGKIGKKVVEPGFDLKRGIVWIGSGLAIYFFTSFPRHQQVWYTLPVLPFFLFFAAYFSVQLLELSKKFSAQWVGMLFLVSVLGYNSVYAMAHLNLYRERNVRELASEWIEKNIPKNESVGIVRSYFWTPGILRQYHPPYRLIQGGDAQSVLKDAVLGLEQVRKKANVIVLTEFEYRNYLTPQFRETYPQQVQVLRSIMEGKEYEEAARFDQTAKFLCFSFPKTAYPPDDWLMPNPSIRIYRKNSSRAT